MDRSQPKSSSRLIAWELDPKSPKELQFQRTHGDGVSRVWTVRVMGIGTDGREVLGFHPVLSYKRFRSYSLAVRAIRRWENGNSG
jgi:hypothetical protein